MPASGEPLGALASGVVSTTPGEVEASLAELGVVGVAPPARLSGGVAGLDDAPGDVDEGAFELAGELVPASALALGDAFDANGLVSNQS